MKRLLTAFIMFIILVIAGCSSSNDVEGGTNSADNGEAGDGEQITFRVGIGNNTEHPHYKGLEKMQEILEEKSDGRFNVELFAGATLGDDREMIEGLQMGTLEATIPAAGVVSNFVTEFEIFNFPFLFTDYETADKVLSGPAGDEILSKLEEEGQGVIGVDIWEQGFFMLTNNSHPVETVDDMKGLKIRSIENEIQLETLRALGANPTPMAYSELFTALQQGAVDGQQNPIAIIYSDKFYEVQEYLTITNHHYGPSIFLVSEIFMDTLSDDDKELLIHAIEEGNKEAKKVLRDSAEQQLEEVSEYLEVVELDEAEMEKFQEAVQPVIDKFTDEIGREFVENFYQAIEDAQ